LGEIARKQTHFSGEQLGILYFDGVMTEAQPLYQKFGKLWRDDLGYNSKLAVTQMTMLTITF